MPVLVAQCLAFLTILYSFPPNTTSTNTRNSAKQNSTSSNDACKSVNELCFVQYMDVLTFDEPSIADIVEAQNCVRVRWHGSNGNDQFLPGKEYGLAPVDSIKGVLDVVTFGQWGRKLS